MVVSTIEKTGIDITRFSNGRGRQRLFLEAKKVLVMDFNRTLLGSFNRCHFRPPFLKVPISSMRMVVGISVDGLGKEWQQMLLIKGKVQSFEEVRR